MANKTWTGVTSDDISVGSNYLPTGAPADGDDVFVPRVASNNMKTAMATFVADNWLSLTIAKDSEVSIGEVGSPLQVSCDQLNFRGSRDFHYKVGSGAPTDDVVIRAATAGVRVVLDGSAQTITNINAMRGNVTLGSGLGTVARLIAGFVDDRNNDLTLNADAGITAISLLKQYGGGLDISCPVTTADIRAGRKYAQSSSGAISTLFLLGRLLENMQYNSTGTLALAFIGGGGFLDLTKTSFVKTITKAWLFDEGSLDYDFNRDSVTIEKVKGSL